MELAVEGMLMNGYYKKPEWTWWGFYVEGLENGSTVKMNKTGSPPNVTLEYSMDGGNTWSAFDVNGGTTITLNENDRVCFRAGSAGNVRFASGTYAYRRFLFTKNVSVGGNIMSLLSQTEITKFPSSTTYQFFRLFGNNTTLKNASSLLMPANSLGDYCYSYMFYYCSALVGVPDLPATQLAPSCYSNMFQMCTSLTRAQSVLPATQLMSYCYEDMFFQCSNLAISPYLPAEETGSYNGYYNAMFRGCSKLNRIMTEQSSFGSCTYWVMDVADQGTLICNPELGTPQTIERGASACPVNWNVVTFEQLKFYIIAEEDDVSISMSPRLAQTYSLEYSLDYGMTWTQFIPGTTVVNLAKNAIACFKAGQAGNTSAPVFYFSKNVSLHGNIIYLLQQDGGELPQRSACFENTFKDCDTIIDASDVKFPKNTVFECYKSMFKGCTRLKHGPKCLPATSLEARCYNQMFQDCAALVDTPVLPARTLGTECYYKMFQGCTSLVSAPGLPATSMSINCYAYMFADCTALVNAPALPAASLNQGCYTRMFQNCKSLACAPYLPASVLSKNCYAYMFDGCEKLRFIRTNQTYFETDNGMQCENWVRGVNATGLLKCPSGLGTSSTIQRGDSACPTNWNVDSSSWEFYVRANEDNVIVSMTKVGSPPEVTLEYSMDCGQTWSAFDADNGQSIELANGGDVVWFRSGSSGNNQFASSASAYRKFTFVKSVSIGGNIMSLLQQTASASMPSYDFTFCRLFSGAFTLRTAGRELLLPGTSLRDRSSSYRNMFYGCNSLLDAPMLPATYIGPYSYEYMFYGCRSLVSPPAVLPTQRLAQAAGSTIHIGTNCYAHMFDGCVNLTYTPQLSASTLTDGCYAYMFQDCRMLTVPPSFEAIRTGGTNGFYRMFCNCISLTSTPDLSFTSSISSWNFIFFGMFENCKSLLSASELPSLDTSNSCYEYMFHNCRALIHPPSVLPAKIVQRQSYRHMFEGCTSMTYAPSMDNMQTLNSYSCCTNMFSRCTSLSAAPKLNPETATETSYYSMFEGCTSLSTAPALPAKTVGKQSYGYMFQGCTSLSAMPDMPALNLNTNCYRNMFEGCTSLSVVSDLPATVLSDNCYFQMFKDCSALVKSPYLPATGLSSYGYGSMFSNCSKLRFIDTKQTSFNGCSKWVEGVADSGIFKCPESLGNESTIQRGISACPEGWTINNWWGFHVQTLEYGVQISMGDAYYTEGSLSLQYSLDCGMTWHDFIPGTTEITVDNIYDIVCFRAGPNGNTTTCGYNFQFSGKVELRGNIMSLLSRTEITEFPDLSQADVFFCLFADNTNVVKADQLSLPANTLAAGCYASLFSSCDQLTAIPELPAMNLADSCYEGLFARCSSIVNAPELPATTLADYCYYGMFDSCELLECAPYLPAKNLATGCYNFMFANCAGLKTITTNQAQIGEDYCFSWVINVNSSGVFTCPNIQNIVENVNNCPPGWTINTWWGFFVQAIEPGATVELTGLGSIAVSLQYSINSNSAWQTFNTQVSMPNAGDYICLRAATSGGNAKFYTSAYAYKKFVFKGKVLLGGNILSLLKQTQITSLPSTTTSYIFESIFSNNDGIINAHMLKLPAPVCAQACYRNLFSGCTNLMYGPETLSAQTLAISCYGGMFRNCKSLINAPTLPATTLSNYCYREMFQNCESLLSAPELPATQIRSYCYQYMFSGCSSLQYIPTELPATTALSSAYSCYQYMFSDCPLISAAPALPATILTSYVYSYMFNNCISLKTPPSLPATTLGNNCYEYMFNVCSSLQTAPDLPAATLENFCYSRMFRHCYSLTTPPRISATSMAPGCCYGMFGTCTSLTAAVNLPATNIGYQSYREMYYNCSSLLSAPDLPATTALSSSAYSCYQSMFSGCTSLRYAPAELPATKLTSSCYQSMFYNCSSLTSAPTIQASSVGTSACAYMFYNCQNISSITTKQQNFNNCLAWTYNVSPVGTFICPTELGTQDTIARGESACPTNWTVINQ